MLTCSRHFRLSASGYLHSMSSAITADMSPPLLTFSECVFPFNEQHRHCWHDVPATFDPQAVCNSIFEEVPSRLTCPRDFRLSGSVYFRFMSCTIKADMFFRFFTQEVRISISWEVPSWLTHSCNLWLLGSAYFYFMRSTITINMSPPLSALSECVFPFRMQHSHGWRVPRLFQLSASANFHFIKSIITVDMSPPLLTLSECVFPFYE